MKKQVRILIFFTRLANSIFPAPYHIVFHLWSVRFYSICPHDLINDTIFLRKKMLNINAVF